MKTITSDFKNEISQFGRQFSNIIGVYANASDKLITEDDKYILTQNDLFLVTCVEEGSIQYELTDENLFRIKLVRKCNLLSSMMKELEFESDMNIKVGTIINYQFGIKVDDDYEYLDYGDFIVYKKEYNEDTKRYVYTCYDSMLKTMVMVDKRELIENVSISTALVNIAEKFGLAITIDNFALADYPNLEKTIATDTFKDMEMTYRDVIDMICQACGFNLYVENNELLFKDILSEPVDTIDTKFFKDTNVTFKEKYGPINSVVLSRSEDSDNIYEQDNESISKNGLHEFKIKDNLLLLGNDREEYLESIFEHINGLEYYLNDYESIGICYLDLLDYYNVSVQGNNYKCLLVNDEITINSGISEKIYTEAPKETVTDYTTAGKTDKEVSFIVDKQKASINAKVSKGDVINEINLDESGATIQANKVNLVGYVTATDLAGSGTTVINGANISTGSINCDRLNGGTINGQTISGGSITGTSITSNSGSIGGWTIENNGLSNNSGFYVKNTGLTNVYVLADIFICSLILQGYVTISSGTPEFRHYDLNNDGVIDSRDMLAIRNLFNQ